jgi:hypothetical protein
MNRFQIFLSRRRTGILLTGIAMIAMLCWQEILPNFDYDNSYSIAAAKNISEGHGYTIRMASADDFSKSYYEPLNKWPPGYSWLLVLIHKLLSTDWIYSTYILNNMGLILIILVFRKMLFQLDYPVWLVNIAVVYFGFLKHPFHYDRSSDIFGVLFFMMGLSILLNAVKSEKYIPQKVILSTVLFGFTAYMKYLYIPLAFAPVISLMAYGYMMKRKDLQFTSVKSLLFLMAIVSSLFLFQYFHSGHMAYLNPSKTGFFPEQLLWLAPIVPASFINIDFINMQVSIHSSIRYESLNIAWSILNFFLIFWLAFISFKLGRTKILSVADFRNFYAIHALVFTGILFGYLSLLSITKSKHYYNTFELWVYLQELRYYAMFTLFLIQFALLILWKPAFFFNKSGIVIFRYLMMIILIIEISHGTYYFYKQIVINKNYGLTIQKDQIYFNSLDLIKKELKKNKNLVFCSNSDKIANMCSLADVPVFFELWKLKKPIRSSQPVTMIIAVDYKIPDSSVPLLLSPEIKPDTIWQNVYYYILNIQKSTSF